jgi:hypothetical protein
VAPFYTGELAPFCSGVDKLKISPVRSEYMWLPHKARAQFGKKRTHFLKSDYK